MELERRQLRLIVLYADFLGLAENEKSLSPKELKRLYSVLLDEMARIVVGFGGTVLKYVKECVVGFFVLPAAGWTQQIDRVLLCTEMMQKVMQHSIGPMAQLKGLSELNCRIGIDCDDVQITGIRVEGTYLEVDVLGDVVNLSREICGKAESGEILLGKGLWQLLYDSHKARCKSREGLLRDEETYELYSLNY